MKKTNVSNTTIHANTNGAISSRRLMSFALALVMIISAFASFAITASAASISRNKHVASNVKGGQTVYIKSNTGWNTELFGNTFRTKVQVKLPSKYFEYFQYNLSTAKEAKMSVTIYKKSGSTWSKYISGKYNCNNKGILTTTFVLPGKGVQYKVVVSPVMTWLINDYLDINKPSDMTNLTVSITSYGTITSVA